MFLFAEGRMPREYKRVTTNNKLFQKTKRRMLERLGVVDHDKKHTPKHRK